MHPEGKKALVGLTKGLLPWLLSFTAVSGFIACAEAQSLPAAPKLAEATGGARLKPFWLVGDDGSRMFSGRWFDQSLGMTCTVSSGRSSEHRCMPDHPAVLIVKAQADCTGADAVVVTDQTHAEQGDRVYELGTQVSGAYRMVGQNCTAVDLDPGDTVRMLGDDVTDALVSFQEQQ